jgi:hypothetical protein
LKILDFLDACGNPTAFEIINSKSEKLPETKHNSLLLELRKYFSVGRMPERNCLLNEGICSDP